MTVPAAPPPKFATRLGRIVPYLLSPLFVMLATRISLEMQRLLAERPDEMVRPFTLWFVLAIALVTILGGWGPGMLTLVLSTASMLYFLIEPYGSFRVSHRADAAALIALIIVGGLILLAVAWGRRAAEQTRASLAASEAARRAAEEARARLQTFLDTVPLGVLTTDAAGVLTYANRETERLWGRPLAAMGSRFWEIAEVRDAAGDGEIVPAERRTLGRTLAGETGVLEAEYVFTRPDGKRAPVFVQSTSVRDPDGNLLGGLSLLTDLTERRRADEARRESEAHHQTLFETVPMGVTYQDRDSHILAANPAAERLLGLTLDQMRGRSSLDPRWRTIHEDGSDFPGDTHPAVTALQTGRLVQNVVMGVFNPRDEAYRWLNVTAVPQFRPGESVPYQVYTIFEDITEQRRVEEERAERTRLFALRADVSNALVQNEPLPDVLRRCAEAVVTHLDAAFARIWMLNEAEDVLEMRASAGLYTHTNGPHGRVRVGEFKIGQIAQERKPHLTNQVIGDPRISDPEWAKREGMVAFAGYPLLMENRLLGVIALFARHPLSPATLETLAPTVNDIALGLERRKATEALRDSQAQMKAILDNSGAVVYVKDLEGRFQLVNRRFETVFHQDREAIQGKTDYDLFPREMADALRANDQKVLAAGMVQESEEVVPHDDGLHTYISSKFPLRDAAGVAYAVCGVSTDITARKQAEAERERLVAVVESSSDFVGIANADGQAIYVNAAGQKMIGLDDMDQVRQTAVTEYFTPDDLAYFQKNILPVVLSEGRWQGEFRFRHFKTGQAIPVSYNFFLTRDPRTGEPNGVATVTRDISEQKQAEVERERLLRNERIANHIAQAQRGSLDPDAVQRVAVEELGWALDADRCYLIQYDIVHDRASIRGDWHRQDLASLAGDFPLSDFRVDPENAFAGKTTLVIPDVHAHPVTSEAAAAYEALGVRAAIFVPLYDEKQRLAAALSVNVGGTPRDWTPGEVALVEAVAAQTHSTMNTARLIQRDRTIAERLQEALRPNLPESVPGLDLREHYLAALSEANVGGDFFDAFTLEKGCVALVVGDLSGKGLAAASQVSLVRNMLRFALYNGRTVAEAIADLNRTLAEHDLLLGFATLFVGVYDAGALTLTYVSCGHEPTLLRRAQTRVIEELGATGPVLGAFAEAVYEEKVVALAEGDALAIYTDGLSEAGRNRHDFLGVEGLALLLAQGGETALSLKDHLVQGVRDHANDDLHDDTCLLVAVVKGTGGRDEMP